MNTHQDGIAFTDDQRARLQAWNATLPLGLCLRITGDHAEMEEVAEVQIDAQLAVVQIVRAAGGGFVVVALPSGQGWIEGTLGDAQIRAEEVLDGWRTAHDRSHLAD